MSYRKARTKHDRIKLMTYIQHIEQCWREKIENHNNKQINVCQLYNNLTGVKCRWTNLDTVHACYQIYCGVWKYMQRWSFCGAGNHVVFTTQQGTKLSGLVSPLSSVLCH